MGLHRGRVEDVDLAAFFEGDAAVAAGRPQDVIVLEGGDLFDLGRLQVIGIEVERQVPVGDEDDLVLDPDGVLVRAFEIGESLGRVLVQIVGPDVLGPAALVALPGAEFAGDGRVGDRPAVRRERAAAGFGDLQGRLQSAVEADQEILPVPLAEGRAVAAEKDLFGIRGPVQDLIVVSAARRHEADRIVIGQLTGRSAFGGDDVHLAGARILARKGNPFAVGADLGGKLQPRVRSQAPGRTPLGRNGPDVAGVDEDEQIAVDVRRPQEPGLAGGQEDRQRQDENRGQRKNPFAHEESFHFFFRSSLTAASIC